VQQLVLLVRHARDLIQNPRVFHVLSSSLSLSTLAAP
jgi:hypothetical protein